MCVAQYDMLAHLTGALPALLFYFFLFSLNVCYFFVFLFFPSPNRIIYITGNYNIHHFVTLPWALNTLFVHTRHLIFQIDSHRNHCRRCCRCRRGMRMLLCFTFDPLTPFPIWFRGLFLSAIYTWIIPQLPCACVFRRFISFFSVFFFFYIFIFAFILWLVKFECDAGKHKIFTVGNVHLIFVPKSHRSIPKTFYLEWALIKNIEKSAYEQKNTQKPVGKVFIAWQQIFSISFRHVEKLLA